MKHAIMPRIIFPLVLLAFSLPSAAFAGGKLLEAIQSQNQQYMESYRANNAAAIVALHTPDATVIAPKFPPARGHDEIGAALVEELALGEGTLELHALEVHRMADDTAYEIGQYKLRIEQIDGSLIEEEGNTLLIWKLDEDSTWRIHVDMWNRSHADP